MVDMLISHLPLLFTVAFALLLVSCVSGAEVSCYVCWGDDCQDDTFEPLTSATEDGCAQCYKVKSTYETYTSTLRGCSSTDTGTTQCTTTTSLGAEVVTCYCGKDLCNDASRRVLSGFLFYTALGLWNNILQY